MSDGQRKPDQDRREALLRDTEERLAAELRGTELLRDLAERLVPEESSRTFYEEILSAAIAITRSDAGTVQLYDPATRSLVLLVTRGLERSMTDHFHRVDADSHTVCGFAIRTNKRTYIDFDDDTDEACRMHVAAGYRSAQATPLLSRAGKPLGMLNTHWREAHHRPDKGQLRLLDLLARQAADLIEARTAREELRASEERQAFLLKLSDALRPLVDANDIQRVAARLAGEHWGMANANYARMESRNGVPYAIVRQSYAAEGRPSVDGDYSLADFPGFTDTMQSGERMIVPEIARDPRLKDADKANYATMGIATLLTVPLVKDGRLVASFAVHGPEPKNWTSADIQLLEKVAERTWAAVERARVEAALQESEEKFRTVFETIDHAFVIQEVIRDDAGRAIDMRYVEINPAFTRQTGLGCEIVGKLVSEVMPDVERFFIDIHDRVARTGTPERFENYNQSTGRWYNAHITAVGGQGRLAASVFEDVSARKLAETALRESEERQAFLLELSDALRPLADAEQITGTATRLLAERLEASRAYYAEWQPGADYGEIARDYAAPGTASLAGRYPIATFRSAYDKVSEGSTWVVEDNAVADVSEAERLVQEDLGVRAWVDVPLLKDGAIRAVLCLVADRPRAWTSSEIALVEQTAERMWAAIERASAEAALRDSEARLRQFGEASQDVLWIRDADSLQWTYLTPAFEAIYGVGRNEALAGNNYRGWLELIVAEDRGRARAAIDRVRKGEHVTFDYRIRRPTDGAIRWLRNTDFPIFDAMGEVSLVGGVGHDLTELRETEQRLQTLIEGIPQLVWRAVDGGQWTWASAQWTAFTGQADSDSHGEGWLAVVHPDDRDRTREIWAGAVEQGEFQAEYRICHSGEGRYRWFQTRATPVRDVAGSVVEWLGTSTDIDDLLALQERQNVLVGELQHRTRNLMGLVRSMANRTGEASHDFQDFRHRFQDRLEALARVQGLLSRLNGNDRVAFDELIETELRALNGEAKQVTLDGPSGVRLRSSMVQTLAMALHELATNAIKYGALSQPEARLAIRWRMDPPDDRGRPWLLIDWRERGVQMPPANAKRQGGGQGRELIEGALPYQLSARTSFELGPDGVHCTIAIPVSATNVQPAAAYV